MKYLHLYLRRLLKKGKFPINKKVTVVFDKVEYTVCNITAYTKDMDFNTQYFVKRLHIETKASGPLITPIKFKGDIWDSDRLHDSIARQIA